MFNSSVGFCFMERFGLSGVDFIVYDMYSAQNQDSLPTLRVSELCEQCGTFLICAPHSVYPRSLA